MSLQLELNHSQRISLTPELKQSLNILQMSAIELNEFLQEFLLDNPLIEWPDRSYGLPPAGLSSQPDSGYRDRRPDMMRDQPMTLSAFLMEQLQGMIMEIRVREVCEFIIGSIDEKGYLDLSLDDIVEINHVPHAIAEEALDHIRSMDPPGVGARSPTDCLLVQLDRLGNGNGLTRHLITHHLQEVAAGKWRELARINRVNLSEVTSAVRAMRQLNPFPGLAFGGEEVKYIHPDLMAEERDGKIMIHYVETSVCALKWNRYYMDMMRGEVNAKPYLRERWQAASWIMRCIKQRKSTMQKVAEAIFAKQYLFLQRGHGFLLPLSMKEVAEMVNLHESTVSRAVHGKYVQTHWGTCELRSFFHSGVEQDDGGWVAADTIKQEIQWLIKRESKGEALSDQKLAEILDGMGIRIARRTVAKYRESLGLAAASARRRRAELANLLD